MKQIMILLILVISISLGAFTNLLKRPESVVYVEELEAFLISNKSGGFIVKMTEEGVQTVFNNDLISVRGIVQVDSLLYCAAEGGVFGISINTGKLVVEIPINDAQFFNDIAWGGDDYLYVTDTEANRVIRVNRNTGQNNPIIVSGLSKPNGIYYDEVENRLLIVSMIEKSPIIEFRLEKGMMSTIRTTKLSNLDGIARDANGYWYVSSWKTGTIYTFDKDFTGKPRKFITHQKGPADISYFAKDNAIIIPNFKGNIVKFAGVRDDYKF